MRIARVLFARIPEPGKVKTRLAADLDEVAALEFYRWLLRVQKRVFSLSPAAGNSYTDYVYYAPAVSRLHARARFYPDLAGLKLKFRPQAEGDLGTRLAAALSPVLHRHDLALIWGADIPALPPHIFLQAAQLAPQSTITLARDGGYAFLSLAAATYSPAVFSNIRWSTQYTGADQLRALKRAGISAVVSGKVADFDRAHNLTRILRELELYGRSDDLADFTATCRRLTEQ